MNYKYTKSSLESRHKILFSFSIRIFSKTRVRKPLPVSLSEKVSAKIWAPFSTKNLTIWTELHEAAQCKGVHPSLSAAFMSTPQWTRNLNFFDYYFWIRQIFNTKYRDEKSYKSELQIDCICSVRIFTFSEYIEGNTWQHRNDQRKHYYVVPLFLHRSLQTDSVP